ncbi:SPOR domain-containing protein [Salinivibrio kushneri]|uniref:Cell division protein DedD n=1 Tax=Salinivibrio kushneri TaxID=1908198 RepID=A0AB36KD67_9GAMM|nr:SPOR domain-containing protein [Salinivibrio kushneri]OOE46613.1 cell division protein DedD [Salinivibrio kushneri]
MASKLQKRIVGTLVLVSIGVIVLPDVLDGKKEHYQESYESIPLRDDFDSEVSQAPIKAPQVVEVDAPDTKVKERQTNELDNEPAPKPASSDTASSSASAQEGAWMIRLGTFSNQDNARRLVKQLREKGYQAHILPKAIQPGDLAKVVVGPHVSKSALESQLTDLQSLTGLKGQLRKFDPLTQ